MPTLKELRKALTTTQADIDRAATPETRSLMQQTPNAGFSVSSDYAFQCACCQALGFPSVYRLVKEQVGPLNYSRKTEVGKISSVKGIFRLDELDFEPEFDSSLHVTRNGNVCDHCYDSVYT